jgi:hypothetical protein
MSSGAKLFEKDPSKIAPTSGLARLAGVFTPSLFGGKELKGLPAPGVPKKRGPALKAPSDLMGEVGLHPDKIHLINMRTVTASPAFRSDGVPLMVHSPDTVEMEMEEGDERVRDAVLKHAGQEPPFVRQSLSFSALIGTPVDAFAATLGALLNQELHATHTRPCLGLILDRELPRGSEGNMTAMSFSLGMHLPLLDENESHGILSELSTTAFWDTQVLWSMTMRSPQFPVKFSRFDGLPARKHGTRGNASEHQVIVQVRKADLLKSLGFYTSRIPVQMLNEWGNALKMGAPDVIEVQMSAKNAYNDRYSSTSSPRNTPLNGFARFCLLTRESLYGETEGEKPVVITQMTGLDPFGRPMQKTVMHLPDTSPHNPLARTYVMR